ncbi:DUF1192 domain-containing protein [Magnetospira sp. QH-2]|uniref:DUF1192 domain-containing protein n=1 Tax=Magnetospira sp. (strain QH-2) TaxID=1288970 RepID=UPI0003E81C25|nr:DUF1192 domain-containing protein [Magnetospira sp. QH-2]CCQ74067.1 Conserved protein of unknown function [Magnetospira sp. QH-2]
MDTDDLEPKRPTLAAAPDLSEMSVEALEEYIGDLNAEIERCRAAITRKEAAREGADSVFKF